ncbi:secG [Symbiodinium sp. CCMP2592]|nr:secG [Symbiodinium sp. CCMP2592]
MIVFEKYSGMLLVNLVISGGKIAAVFILRQIIGSGRLYLVDPVTCAAFLASYSDHLSKDTLHRVAERGLADYLAALLSAGFDKDAQAQKEDRDSSFRSGGDTPLHRAALVGHAGCVDLLLKAGAKKELKDYRSGLRLNAGRWIEICAGFVFCVTVASDSGEAMPLQPHSELFRG